MTKLNVSDAPDARVFDLVAKIAKVSLRDTLRVLLAAELVRRRYGINISTDMIDADSSERPMPNEIADCERVYAEFEQDSKYKPMLADTARIRLLLKNLMVTKKML